MRPALLVLAGLLAAAAPPPGAQSCTGCHAAGSAMGALDGMADAAIEASMAGYRDGTAPATIMNRIARGFTPEQTRAIAQWFAGRQP